MFFKEKKKKTLLLSYPATYSDKSRKPDSPLVLEGEPNCIVADVNVKGCNPSIKMSFGYGAEEVGLFMPTEQTPIYCHIT